MVTSFGGRSWTASGQPQRTARAIGGAAKAASLPALKRVQKVEEMIMRTGTTISKAAAFITSRKGVSVLFAAAALIASVFISSGFSAKEVSDDSGKQAVMAACGTGDVQVFRKAGYALSDRNAYVTENTGEGIRVIKILRAFDMNVVDGGKASTVSAVSGTVRAVLQSAGISLPGKNDVVNVSLDAAASEGMTVRIDRVKYVKSKTTKTIQYKTVTKNDSSLESGKTKVSVKGVNGTKEVTTTKKYVNGKLADTKTTEKVTKKAVNKVVLKGTKKASKKSTTSKKTTTSNKSKTTVNKSSKTITVNGKTLHYSKVLTGSGTAYTERKGSRTATGQKVRVGLVAVNPKVIPYGTKLYITTVDGSRTYGYAVAADTGGALKSGRALVDLFYNTEKECRSFGRRQVKVYILD